MWLLTIRPVFVAQVEEEVKSYHTTFWLCRSPFAGPLPTEFLTGGQVDSSDPAWLAAELAPGRPSRASAFQEIDLNGAAGAVRVLLEVPMHRLWHNLNPVSLEFEAYTSRRSILTARPAQCAHCFRV